jgi:hypothetical protein
MVQIAGGGSVVVTVGDQILHEYQVDEVIKDNVKAYTCSKGKLAGREEKKVGQMLTGL